MTREDPWYELWDLERGNLLGDDETAEPLRKLRQHILAKHPEAYGDLAIFHIDECSDEEEIRIVVWKDDPGAAQ